MGAIKLPKKSIKFFKNNQDKIFKSGALSEGIWNKKLSRKEAVKIVLCLQDEFPKEYFDIW